MIIFDLDGTLADCEHRKHFIDPIKAGYYECGERGSGIYSKEVLGERFKPDWKSFYEACDKDEPLKQTIEIFHAITKNIFLDIEIWSGRCESVREKTINWLYRNINILIKPDNRFRSFNLKMRPIGFNDTDQWLIESWLIDQFIFSDNKIDMIFTANKKIIDTCTRRGIFVFDVSQGKGNF